MKLYKYNFENEVTNVIHLSLFHLDRI